MFIPIKVIGHIDLKARVNRDTDYPWMAFKRESTKSCGESLMEEEPANYHERQAVKPTPTLDTKGVDDFKDMSEAKNSVSAEGNDNLLEKFENETWLKTGKGNKTKPKAIADKKLAIRSDVVNKTLLRSLKRYYTAKFEADPRFRTTSRSPQKDEVYEKIREFTEEIYTGDKRFNEPEFSEVTMDALVFYMGI